MREKPTKLKLYLLRYRGNVPGEIVSTRLAGRFYAYRSRFLVGPLAQCLGAFGFYSNVTKHAGFRSESCGIGSLSKIDGVSDHEYNSDDSFGDANQRH